MTRREKLVSPGRGRFGLSSESASMPAPGTSAKRKADRLELFCAAPQHTLLQVMERINQNGQGIALVVDSEGRLLDTITDGDLRRAILGGADLHHPVGELRARRAGDSSRPVTALVGTSRRELLRTMRKQELRHIPLMDREGRVADVACLSELMRARRGEELALSAVVMAGGEGARLRPLTEHTPKPLLPVGDKPVVERIVHQLRDAGIRRVNLATHNKSAAFAEHFGNGNAFGVTIDYVAEEQPLGTAGALGKLRDCGEPLLVINGDILTRLNYRAFVEFHRDNRADMTVGLRRYDINVPYGVVQTEGVAVSGIQEKPTQKLFVNAGIYLLEPAALRYVPQGKRFDMTDLIAALLADGRRVVGFPIGEYWLDIGQPADYERAQLDAQKGRLAP